MYKLTELQVQNIKRIKAVRITPDPAKPVVVIAGNNGQGKTSVLDSIEMLLRGKASIPAQPVRVGESEAFIIGDFGEFKVRRSFRAGNTTLVVEDAKGFKQSSPQSFLDKLMGYLSFDPLAFMRQSAKEQLDTLKGIVGLNFDELDEKREAAYNERTEVNRDIARVEGAIKTMPAFPQAPIAEVSFSETLNQINEVNAYNESVHRLNTSLENSKKSLETLQSRKLALLAQLQEVEKLQGIEQQAHDKLEKMVAESPIKSTAELEEKLKNAETINAQVRANLDRAEKEAELENMKAASEKLTQEIAAIDADKEKQLSAAKFPVAGLSFNASGVLYNGLPLSQASGAEQLRVSVAIGAAVNPGVRIMLIRDGSLLDENSMKLLEDLAREYQITPWIERVGDDKKATIIIEDGEEKK